MKHSDPDFAAVCERLPVLRRHEEIMRTRLHQHAIRFPGTRGDTLDRVIRYLRDNVQSVSQINRAFMKRLVVFADHVVDGIPPEEAAWLACRAHPDPISSKACGTPVKRGGLGLSGGQK